MKVERLFFGEVFDPHYNEWGAVIINSCNPAPGRATLLDAIEDCKSMHDNHPIYKTYKFRVRKVVTRTVMHKLKF